VSTALTERQDAQVALDRPLTLADLGKRIEAERKAMKNLERVADDECRWGNGSPTLRAAVIAVKEARRG